MASDTVPVVLPGGGCAYPAWILSQARTRRPAQAQRRRAMVSGTVPVVLPGGGCALPGLQDPLTGSHPQARASVAPPGDGIRHDSRDFAGRRRRLPGLLDPSHRLTPVGPRKRIAAGRDIRHDTRDGAGRRRLTRPTGSFHRLTPRRPARSAAGRDFRLGTLILPGGGCAPAYRILSQAHTP
nr:hypothetical protein [Klebsiella pneumoniae subsp. pneumoniae]